MRNTYGLINRSLANGSTYGRDIFSRLLSKKHAAELCDVRGIRFTHTDKLDLRISEESSVTGRDLWVSGVLIKLHKREQRMNY